MADWRELVLDPTGGTERVARSLLEAVADLAEEIDPGRVAVVQGDRERTWADLDGRAARLAAYLERCGVRAADRVGLGLYNSIEYVESLLAVFKLRAVPVNVNYRYREGELAERSDRARGVAAGRTQEAPAGRLRSIDRAHDVRQDRPAMGPGPGPGSRIGR